MNVTDGEELLSWIENPLLKAKLEFYEVWKAEAMCVIRVKARVCVCVCVLGGGGVSEWVLRNLQYLSLWGIN